MLVFPLIPIVVIGVLVMTNAFFATTEFSLVTVRRTWLRKRLIAVGCVLSAQTSKSSAGCRHRRP